MRSSARLALFGMALSGSVALPRHARADDKSDCLAAFDESQKLRAAGKAVDALDRARLCMRDVCPAVVRPLCAGFVTDLQTKVATITVEVRDAAGTVISNASSQVDGRDLPAGRALTLDPGTYRVRVEHPSATPVEQSVTVKGGETRTITIVLLRRPEPAPVASASASAPPLKTDPPPTPARTSVLPYVLGGVGVLGLASFAIFALSGKSQQNQLQSSCAPYCADDDVSPVRRKYLIADVSLAVGIGSLAAAAWLFFSPSSSATQTTASRSWQLGAAPLPGGATMAVDGRF